MTEDDYSSQRKWLDGNLVLHFIPDSLWLSIISQFVSIRICYDQLVSFTDFIYDLALAKFTIRHCFLYLYDLSLPISSQLIGTSFIPRLRVMRGFMLQQEFIFNFSADVIFFIKKDLNEKNDFGLGLCFTVQEFIAQWETPADFLKYEIIIRIVESSCVDVDEQYLPQKIWL